MQSLTREELDCLKRIDAGLNCPQTVIDKLVAEGFVERGTKVILPQLPQGFGSPRQKLTFAGKQALASEPKERFRNNLCGLRRIFVCQQGAERGA